MIQILVFITAIITLLFPASAEAMKIDITKQADNTSVSIFAYQRINEDLFPDTSIHLDAFKSHIQEIITENYTVLSLDEMIQAFETGRALPPKTIAITFDGGYQSILQTALPLLDEHGLPYTIFVAPDNADAATKNGAYLSWKQIQRLYKKDNVTIGLHPARYTRLSGLEEGKIRHDINKAVAKYREELGAEPKYFSYPFGEYSELYKKIIQEQSFAAALTQMSGKAYIGSDLYDLPRFTMTVNYDTIERFRMTANALPFPVRDIHPNDPQLNAPLQSIGFTLPYGIAQNAERLSCFVSDIGRVPYEIIGEKRVEIRLDAPINNRRIRMNCTLPVKQPDDPDKTRWRWLGFLFIAAPDEE